MIARIWTTRIDEERAAEYEAFAQHISLPMFRCQPGFRGVTMLRRGDTCLVITKWKDASSIMALERSPAYLETVKKIRHQGFLCGDQSVQELDIHLVFQEDRDG